MRNADETYAYTNYIDSDIVNPINQIEQTYDNWTTNRFVGNVFGEMDLTPNLKFRSSVNVDLALGSQKIFFPTFDLALFPGDPNRPATEFREVNSLIRGVNKWSTWQWENTLTYTKEFENEDKLQVIAGYSALESNLSSITASRDSLATNDPTYAFLSNSLNVAPQTTGQRRHQRNGLDRSVCACDLRLGQRVVLDGHTSLRRVVSLWLEQPLRVVPVVLCGVELDGTSGSLRKTGSTSSRCVEAGAQRKR